MCINETDQEHFVTKGLISYQEILFCNIIDDNQNPILKSIINALKHVFI